MPQVEDVVGLEAERMYTALDENAGNVIVKDVDTHVHHILDLPKTFAEAWNGPESKFWRPSIKDELKSLRENHTWDIVRINQDMQRRLPLVGSSTRNFNQMEVFVINRGWLLAGLRCGRESSGSDRTPQHSPLLQCDYFWAIARVTT